MHCDILIINGKCLSNINDIIYDWIAVVENNIIDVGFSDDYITRYTTVTRLIDAQGATVLPGFYDSHVHLVQSGLNSLSVDLSDAKSFEDIGNLIHDQKIKMPGEPINAIGLHIYNLKEKCFPGRAILDKFCNDVPLWISSKEFYLSALNTYGLLFYKIPFTMCGVQLDTKSMPTGVFNQQANVMLRENILKSISTSYRLKAVEGIIQNAISKGITTINAMEGGFLFCDKDAEFVHDYADSFPIEINLYYQTSDIKRVKEMGLKRIGSRPLLDGTMGSRNAALSFNYADNPDNKGELFIAQDALNDYILECYKNSLQTALHAIGDRAIEAALYAHENAVKITGNTGLRHRVEHCELVNLEQIQKAKDLGLVFSMQPTYEYLWGGKGKMYETRIGSHYTCTNPFKEIIQKGVVICGSSEGDVTPIDPILGIHSAVNHPVVKHRVSVKDAIKMFTLNGAYAVFEEESKGSLGIGKQADIVVLNRDICNIPKHEIKDVKVTLTIKSGCILYDSGNLLREGTTI